MGLKVLACGKPIEYRRGYQEVNGLLPITTDYHRGTFTPIFLE